MFQDIIDWCVGLVGSLGGPGVGLAVALENLFPPIPSEAILPLAGFSASNGDFSLISAYIWATVGSLVGALALYALGRGFGRDRLVKVANALPLVDAEDVEKAEAWFAKHGTKAVLFGRLVPLVRSLISIPAGTQRMPVGKFLLFTLIGSGLWNTLLVTLGYALGNNWNKVGPVLDRFDLVIYIGGALLILWWLVRQIRKRQRRVAAEKAAQSTATAVGDPASETATEPVSETGTEPVTDGCASAAPRNHD